MKIELELEDWTKLRDTATAIVRNAKRDIALWMPALEEINKRIEELNKEE